MSKEREYNMDLLRIVCCFLIVLLHFSSSYWDCVPIGSYSFNVMIVYNAMTRVGVPVFIMLSGYFLLGKDYDLSIKAYLKRPAKMVVTFYIWAAFYALQGLIVELIRTHSATAERLAFTKNELIYGHYHMWFCFLIIGYYILLPIAKKIAEDIKILNLFIILWILAAFILPCVFAWCHLNTLSALFEKLELNVVKGYFGYFLLGYYIKSVNWTGKKKAAVYITGIISFGITLYLSIYQSISTGTYISTWFSPGSPFVLATSAAVFLLFYSLDINVTGRTGKILVTVSESTFFIYMLHVFILEKLNLAGITTISFNPLFAVPLLTCLAFAIALLAALVVRKIPVIGKILMFRW